LSVRVAYVRRTGRGLVLRSLRLVGQSSDASWPERGSASRDDAVEQNPTIYADAAVWLKSNLQSARSRDGLEMICLDASGSILSWLSAPSTDDRVVGSLARQGPTTADGVPSNETTPVSYFAPGMLDSSIQALPGQHEGPESESGKGSKNAPALSMRLATLAATDLPARLLVDALDAQDVYPGEVATIWHAMAMAWDRFSSSDDATVNAPLTAVVMLDADARLVWCWSVQGRLIAGGSLRVRVQAPIASADPLVDDVPPLPVVTRDDVARLTSEWLTWAMQLSRSPQRVVCVLPERLGGADSAEDLRPGEVGEEIARAWPGCAVDAALHDDPLEATLRRLVTVLESTPVSGTPDAGRALKAIASRPGASYRRMYIWTAASLALVGAGLGVLGLRFRQDAKAAERAAQGWEAAWREPVKKAFPDLRPRPNASELMELQAMIKDKESMGKLPSSILVPKPVLQELEAMSLVVATPSIELRSITMNNDRPVQLICSLPTTADAEAMLDALRRVGGSTLENWTMEFNARGTPGNDRREVTYTANWPNKAGGPR
jgi:hypothetical protein